jgi:ribonuclease HI
MLDNTHDLCDYTTGANMQPFFKGYSDGACRSRQTHAAWGALLIDQFGKRTEKHKYIGKASNNEAEYRGLIGALEMAVSLGAVRLAMNMDSELVVRQVTGIYQVSKPELAALLHEAKSLIAKIPSFTIRHIYREKNQDADALANLAIDNFIQGNN